MGCESCKTYKMEAASQLQPYFPVNYESFTKKSPTYSAMSLKDATKEFVNNYITTVALDYRTTKRNELRKNVGMTREGLTNLIKNTETNKSLEEISEKLENNPNYAFDEDPIKQINDPISKYFVEEARKTPEGYNLKRDIAGFKRTYANNRVRTVGFYNAAKELGYDKALQLDTNDILNYGLDDAAKTLDISKRRLHDLVKEYYTQVKPENNEDNSIQFNPKAAEKAEEERIEEEKRQEISNNVIDFSQKAEEKRIKQRQESLDEKLKAA